jgi:hypothetical protein
LTEIGFAEDLKTCGSVDSVAVLPVLSGTVIKLKKEETRQMDLSITAQEKQSP